MCTQPIRIDGYEVACGQCNECLKTYKNTWTARAMAEKRALGYAYAFTLTYADVTNEAGEKLAPLGAKVFRYKDVQNMWKRIRAAANRRWGSCELRYIIVGERGTKNGRCHYHGVMFSDRPVIELGEITWRDKIWSFFNKGHKFKLFKKRLGWSLWGHGFVEFQEPSRRGMAYVLKYILKGRFTSSKTKGTVNEANGEYVCRSTLWVSTGRSIGETWLFGELRAMLREGRMPRSLRMRVPGAGDWYIRGPLQRKMCLWLRDRQLERWAEGGDNYDGWLALIKSVEQDIELDTGEVVRSKAWEWLVNGEEEQKTEYHPRQALKEKLDFLAFKDELKRKQAASNRIKCYGVRPCGACDKYRSQDLRDGDIQCEKLWREVWESQYVEGGEPFDYWIKWQGIVADGCLAKEGCEDDFLQTSRSFQTINAARPKVQGST